MGPESVETQTPPFWQGLWRSQESTVLARTPCERRKNVRTHYHTEGVGHSYLFAFSVAAPQKIKEAVSRNNNGQKIHSDMRARLFFFSSRPFLILKSFNARGFFWLAFHLPLPLPSPFIRTLHSAAEGKRTKEASFLPRPPSGLNAAASSYSFPRRYTLPCRTDEPALEEER